VASRRVALIRGRSPGGRLVGGSCSRSLAGRMHPKVAFRSRFPGSQGAAREAKPWASSEDLGLCNAFPRASCSPVLARQKIRVAGSIAQTPRARDKHAVSDILLNRHRCPALRLAQIATPLLLNVHHGRKADIRRSAHSGWGSLGLTAGLLLGGLIRRGPWLRVCEADDPPPVRLFLEHVSAKGRTGLASCGDLFG
jgi:hypothetical protein